MSEESGSSSLIGAGRLSVPLVAIQFAVSRSSGPGGQNVNKQNTRLELRLPIAAIRGLTPEILQRLTMLAGKKLVGEGELRLVSQATRSLEQNREIALEQLRQLLLEACNVPKKRHATKPSRGARRRRLQAKKHRGEIKATRRGDAGE